MDGLNRKVASYLTVRVRRSKSKASLQDLIVPNDEAGSVSSKRVSSPTKRILDAYVVSAKDVLKSWDRRPVAIVLLPAVDGEGDGGDWNSKSMRILADEIAFNNQAVVIVPDITRGAGRYNEEDDDDRIFDDIVAALQFAKKEYEVKALCLAGVGAAAGRALEVSCDLFDAAFIPFWEELKPIFDEMVAIDFAGNDFETHPVSKKVLKLLADGDTLQRVVAFGEDELLELADPLQTDSSTADWDLEGRIAAMSNNSRNADFRKDFSQFSRVLSEEDEDGEIEQELNPKESSNEEEVMSAAGLSTEEISGLLREVRETFQEVTTTIPTAAVANSSEDSQKKDGSNPNNVKERQLPKWRSLLTRIDRLSRLAEDIVSSRSLPPFDRRIVSDFASVTAVELRPLVPAAAMAILPKQFNIDFVGRLLKIPTIIAFAGTDADR